MPAKEKCEKVNWRDRHDLNSVDGAIKLKKVKTISYQ